MAQSKYEEWLTEEGLIRITGWARDGLTDDDIATNMGISRSTLSAWKKLYPTFSDTLKRNKEIVDRIVESELQKKTTGFVVDLIKPMKVTHKMYNKDGKLKSVTEKYIDVTVQEWVPAEVTAQIFWLKNRKRVEWRDRVDTNLSTEEPIKFTLDYSKLSTEELRKWDELWNKAKVDGK